jgi:ryanodine receptor 2
MQYIPQPVDTSRIVLPKEIDELIEKLAENTHEIWAQQRMKDGWTYGEQRDDMNLKHPGLVPYNDLPESEKVYDRNTAVETLKLVVALGYRIVKN